MLQNYKHYTLEITEDNCTQVGGKLNLNMELSVGLLLPSRVVH